MAFITDKQTLEDLNLLGKYKNDSIFSLFNNTCTRGGEQTLEQMFRNPFTDVCSINKRADIFNYFRMQKQDFPLKKELVEAVEHYLSTAAHPNRWIALMNTCRRRFLNRIASEQEYELIRQGLTDTIKLLHIWQKFNSSLNGNADDAYAHIRKEVNKIMEGKQLTQLLHTEHNTHFSWLKIARYDHILRANSILQLKKLMGIVYETDVYISVAAIAEKQGFTIATAHPHTRHFNNIYMEGLHHPHLSGAVTNNIEVSNEQNVIFLTGANMAGKSTFMKSFAIAVYLAHIGFPVAARKMDFSIKDGLYTSINVSDNLNMGYSHFYAEVLRVKQVALEVAAHKNLVIIFDELFKGTNVKDAYDATVAVTAAFSGFRNCSYIISTHITEAGHTLQQNNYGFRFVYLPTIMQGNIPTYTYQLTEGITNDRHGMLIIRNEKILEIIHTPG